MSRCERAGVFLLLSISAAPAWAQSTTRLSVGPGGLQGDDYSAVPSISADGRYVAFFSDATNLVPGDTNLTFDVFVRDLQAGTTTRVSVDSSGAQAAGGSGGPAISPDGRYVGFWSQAANLVAGDTNGCHDVFVRDLQTNTTFRASVGAGGAQADGISAEPDFSADGRYVAFRSEATNLVPGDSNALMDVFVRDLETGTTARVSLDSAGLQGLGQSNTPSISADGRYVAFESLAENLVPGDMNNFRDVFVHDRLTGATTRISADSAGGSANEASSMPSISDDGRYVAFRSYASDLVAGDTNGVLDVFVRDRQTGQTSRVSVSGLGAQASTYSDCGAQAFSADGRFVAFWSPAANLVPGDTNAVTDVFVRDRVTGSLARVSLTNASGQANGSSVGAALSADARRIAFTSFATDLVAGDTNGFMDVFLRDSGPAAPAAFCFGDGSSGHCPCGNTGTPGRGCENSAGTGGASLGASGQASLANDTLVLVASGELPTALSIPTQGDLAIAPIPFGDGLRCVGGNLKRLYVRNAVGGTVSVPQAGDPSISARSAALGDPIPQGASRLYYVYYRDPNAAFCPPPAGQTWNVTSSLAIVWSL